MTAPRRRWFRFSLRTLFVVVTLLAIPLGWIGYQLNWIRQRRQFIERGGGLLIPTSIHGQEQEEFQPAAPGGLWIFGEQGNACLWTDSDHEDEGRRLFPEAIIDTSEKLEMSM